MSLYTTEVRYICETAAGLEESTGFTDVNKILSEVWDKVIPQGWEIWDENYRPVLCQKILKHYYTREIGLETVGLWQLKLETKLNEIMPYYNELYRTKLLTFDPFRDVDYYTEHEGKERTLSEETTGDEGSSENWNVYSDTPQGALTNVKNETYLTDARKITGNYENAGTRNGDINNTDEYVTHIYGKYSTKTYMSLIKEVRDIIINIDLMIIDDLKDLFLNLWR